MNDTQETTEEAQSNDELGTLSRMFMEYGNMTYRIENLYKEIEILTSEREKLRQEIDSLWLGRN